MFQRIQKFLSSFFRRIFFPVRDEKETAKEADRIVSQKQDEPAESQKIEKEVISHKQEIPVQDALAEKHRRRKARRAKKKAATENRRTYPETSKRVNRHGIPIFAKNDDLSELFIPGENKKKPEEHLCEEELPQEDFSEMLEANLDKGNFQSLLDEKESSLFSEEVLPISEIIKMYPEPEHEIDLHGYTAKKAVAKTETFIQNAYWNGIQTLRIIVGKGLHSQGKAVLPDVVENKIAHLKKNDIVLTFKWENNGKRRSGAVIVYLNQE